MAPESRTSKSWDCTSSSATFPLALVRRMCFTPADSKTFPRLDWGPQQNSIIVSYAGKNLCAVFLPFFPPWMGRGKASCSPSDSFNSSTWSFIVFRQKLKDCFSSAEIFQSFVVTSPILVNTVSFIPVLEVFNFGGFCSKSLGVHRKITWQQGIEELLAFDVVKSTELIFFKLPWVNALCSALGKCELAPLISLSNLTLQLEVCSPSPFSQVGWATCTKTKLHQSGKSDGLVLWRFLRFSNRIVKKDVLF